MLVTTTGRRRVVRFATERQAAAWRTEASAHATSRAVGDAVEAYLEDKAKRGRADSTIATDRYRLRSILRVDDVIDGGALASLTPRRAAALLARLTGAVVTRRLTLATASSWARWCARQGWLRGDPFDGLVVEGRASRGKPQHRVDEARTFAAHLYRAAAAGDAHALAVLLTLLCGRRASEITSRQVRDLDDDGRVLWIASAKTRAGRLQLEVPELVRGLLQRQASGRASTDPLFPNQSRHTLHHHCARLCAAAGVAVVSPQSLRGLHATLARPLVSTPAIVSAALGHAGQAVTERHYYEPGALARDDQRRALDRLGVPTRKDRN